MKKNRILAAVTATLLCMPATSSIFAAGHQQHTWNQGVWTWRSNTSAYVTLTCTEDGAKQLSAGKITVSQQPATCTEPGKTIYIASTSLMEKPIRILVKSLLHKQPVITGKSVDGHGAMITRKLR